MDNLIAKSLINLFQNYEQLVLGPYLIKCICNHKLEWAVKQLQAEGYTYDEATEILSLIKEELINGRNETFVNKGR